MGINCWYQKIFGLTFVNNHRISYEHNEIYSCTSITQRTKGLLQTFSQAKPFMPYRIVPNFGLVKKTWLNHLLKCNYKTKPGLNKVSHGIAFHRFPIEIKSWDDWVGKVNCKGRNSNFVKDNSLCSVHFTSDELVPGSLHKYMH